MEKGETMEQYGKLEVRVQSLEMTVQDMRTKQEIQSVQIASIEKSLDKISNNTSKTFWTVIAGILTFLVLFFAIRYVLRNSNKNN